jgi:hypothetical protein
MNPDMKTKTRAGMNLRRPIFSALALFACGLLAVPADLQSQAAATGQQHAGKVTIVLPVAYLIHDTTQTPAKVAAPVYWGDVINTGHLSRARVALDDGSLLSVGSDSNMTVAKHDAGSQQTDLELNFGRVRAKAVDLAKPNAHFEIRTPAGVAGVVGTEFVMDYTDGTTHVVVLKGKVRLCSYVKEKKNDQEGDQSAAPAGRDEDQQDRDKKRGVLGPCIFIGAGASSSVRFNQSPTSPVVATPVTMSSAIGGTNPSVAGAAAGAGISAGTATIVGVTTAVAVTVTAVVVRAVTKTPVCSNTPTTGIRAAANCKGNTPGIRP